MFMQKAKNNYRQQYVSISDKQVEVNGTLRIMPPPGKQIEQNTKTAAAGANVMQYLITF